MTKEITEAILHFDDAALVNTLFGPQNMHLVTLSEVSGASLGSRGQTLVIKGDEETVAVLEATLTQLYGLLKTGSLLQASDYAYAFHVLEDNLSVDLKQLFQKTSVILSPRKTIAPKTLNQRAYIEALNAVPVTIAVGPAGTGKTYIAVALALSMLLSKKVKRLILTRPAVEAGEKLGFLPGDMAQKVNPYLRPLFDALHDMLDFERVQEMIDTGVIEIAPLAFMRGRTLNDAFIILDEAQNTTIEQMKMFVTRLGFGSHMAITGDVTQIDLPDGRNAVPSGLVHALEVLQNVEDIQIIHFHEKDVIRHPLVGRIVKAYDAFQKHSR